MIKTLTPQELKVYLDLKEDMDRLSLFFVENKLQGYNMIIHYKDKQEIDLIDYYFSADNEELLIGATEKINKGLLMRLVHEPKIQ